MWAYGNMVPTRNLMHHNTKSIRQHTLSPIHKTKQGRIIHEIMECGDKTFLTARALFYKKLRCYESVEKSIDQYHICV